MNVVKIIVEFFGSIGLFVFGMMIMSDALQKTSGKKLEKILHLMTKHRLTGILTGLLITAVIQSSAATTVMVVGFTNAGMLTLTQAIPVIMGANIGTTITAWIVSLFGFKLNITICAFFLLMLSLPLQFVKKESLKNIGNIFAGLGILFVGLYFIQIAIPDPNNNIKVFSFIQKLATPTPLHLISCALLGMLLTAILQSSSVSMAITITLASVGWIGPFQAVSLCLGQNIGTTITALLSSIHTNANAKRAAVAHMLFNVIGSIVALCLIYPLMHLVNLLTPGDIFSDQGDALYSSLPFFLSMFHTVFNVLNTVVFFPFVKQFATLVEFIVKDKSLGNTQKKYVFSISPVLSYAKTPELYLGALKEEIYKLGALSYLMISNVKKIIQNPNADMSKEVNKMHDDETYGDEMQDVLTSVCVDLMKQSPSDTIMNNLTCFIRIIDEFESITDSCYTLTLDATKRKEDGYMFSKEAETHLVYYVDMVSSYLNYVVENMKNKFTNANLMRAYDFENNINKERANLVSYVEKRMRLSSDNIQKELILFDMTRHLEHIGDFCTNIAQTYIKQI